MLYDNNIIFFGKDGPQRTIIQLWVNAFEDHGNIGPRRVRTRKILDQNNNCPVAFGPCSNFRQHINMRYNSDDFLLTAREQLSEALNLASLTRKVLIFLISYLNIVLFALIKLVLEYRARE